MGGNSGFLPFHSSDGNCTSDENDRHHSERNVSKYICWLEAHHQKPNQINCSMIIRENHHRMGTPSTQNEA